MFNFDALLLTITLVLLGIKLVFNIISLPTKNPSLSTLNSRSLYFHLFLQLSCSFELNVL